MDSQILFDKSFPETQVRAPYQLYSNNILGQVYVTSGFMEGSGHGFKSKPRKAIFKNGQLIVIPPGNYNIGFDYSSGFGSSVKAMYSGTVVRAGREGNYGHRVHLKLKQKFFYQGYNHDVFQAYAHCQKLHVTKGSIVSQGQAIAIEAGFGATDPYDYPSHVDFDTYIYLNGEPVSINFELLANSQDSGKIEGDFQLSAIARTVIKRELKQSTQITNPSDKFNFFPESNPLEINWYRDRGNHWEFALKFPINDKYEWFAYKPDIAIS